jgi:glucose-1-phosphate cytidylyltransferase
MTGARINKIEKYIDTELFMLTYGDGVANINIQELLKFHKSHGKIDIVTGVNPYLRFGEFNIRDEVVATKDN